MSDDATLLELLWRSLHSTCGAEDRWAERRARGLTDAELREAIGYEYGLSGGSSGPEGAYSYHGGANPGFGFGSMVYAPQWKRPGERYVRGRELLRLAREVLQIGEPDGQMRLL